MLSIFFSFFNYKNHCRQLQTTPAKSSNLILTIYQMTVLLTHIFSSTVLSVLFYGLVSKGNVYLIYYAMVSSSTPFRVNMLKEYSNSIQYITFPQKNCLSYYRSIIKSIELYNSFYKYQKTRSCAFLTITDSYRSDYDCQSSCCYFKL